MLTRVKFGKNFQLAAPVKIGKNFQLAGAAHIGTDIGDQPQLTM